MPTIVIDGPYSLVFFSSDRSEPIHIHVKRERKIAKYWLNPILLAKNHGFKDHESNRIARLVEKHEEKIIEAWHEYFDN